MATNVGARELRPAPGIGTSFRQQAWLLGVSGRWVFLILGLVAVLMLIGLSDVPREVPRILISAMLALLGGAIWPVMVWHGEGPDRRSYHWSLPVPRPAHDLARVALGAVYLLGVCAVLAAAGALAASMNGTFDRFAAIGPEAWANFFVAPLIVYLLVSPVVLWSDYPITRWVFGIIFGMGLLAVILSWQGLHQLGEGMSKIAEAENWGLGPALFGILREVRRSMELPAPVDLLWTAAALWFTLGLALTLFAGIYRPDDLRRFVRHDARPAAAA